MDIPILTRDDHYVVLDKPAGLAVHPGRAGGPSVEDAFPALSRRKDGPWLAHRLDTDTSGCLVVALRKAALIAVQAEFAAGRAEKTYWAVVQGEPRDEHGEIDARLAKHTKGRAWKMMVDPAGQAAVTGWRVLGREDGRAWLELVPRTGRTHQIRAHCAALGWPILGDAIYGLPGARLHLLARAVRIPAVGIAAVAPPPPHMRDALRRFTAAPAPSEGGAGLAGMA